MACAIISSSTFRAGSSRERGDAKRNGGKREERGNKEGGGRERESCALHSCRLILPCVASRHLARLSERCGRKGQGEEGGKKKEILPSPLRRARLMRQEACHEALMA